MSLFKMQSITVKSKTRTLGTDGKITYGTAVTKTIKGNIQDFELDKLMLEEFGGNVTKACLVVSPDAVAIDEFVEFNGEDYRIMKLGNYSNQKILKNGRFQAIGVIYD